MYMHIICFHLVHCDRHDSNDDGDGDDDEDDDNGDDDVVDDDDDDDDDDDHHDDDHCDDYIHIICTMTNIYIIIDEYTLGGLS